MKKASLIGIIIIALSFLLISFFPEVSPKTSEQQSNSATSTDSTSSGQANSPQATTSSQQTSKGTLYVKAERMSSGRKTTEQTLSNLTIPVSLKVREKVYITDVQKGSTVLDAMKSIAASSDFRFHTNYYAGLGYYVDEINGVKSDSEAFWIYYVRGVQANVGVNSYILKSEDLIVWKLEDSNKNEYYN